MYRQIFLIVALTLFVPQTGRTNERPSGFAAIGSYSDMRFTEEHQYGSEVQLWKEGTDLFGLFSYAEGLMGDTPIGLLEDVKYDPASGTIAFRSRLTTGQHFCKVHNNVPSRDVFFFQGTLTNSSLTGVLKRSDALHPENPAREEKVSLKKMAGEAWDQPSYDSRAGWEAAVKQILTLRGPKW